MNAFVWDLRYPDASNISSGNNALISGSLAGPIAVPGKYTAKLYIGNTEVAEQPFEIVKDPRVDVSQEDLQKQFDLLRKINKKQSEISEAVNQIRKISKAINEESGNIKDSLLVRNFKKIAQPILDTLKMIEGELTQPKAVTDYDLFNFPNRLNDKMASLRNSVGTADAAPTQQAYEVFADLSVRTDLQLEKLKSILSAQLPDINKFIEEQKMFLIKEEKK
jgi:hypothetical protein